LAIPSLGWIAERHGLIVLCRTYTNLVVARVEEIPGVTVLRWPELSLGSELDDRGADRIGQIPFTQGAFDQLGRSLGDQIEDLLTKHERTDRGKQGPASGDAESGSAGLTAYLQRLQVKVLLSRVGDTGRSHVEHLVRSAATFTLTGEQRGISDAEIDAILQEGECMLVSVSDRHGNYGISGFVEFGSQDDSLVIHSLALSCAVLGKRVEHAVVSSLAEIAAQRSLKNLVFMFRTSERNEPMLAFLRTFARKYEDDSFMVSASEAKARIGTAASSVVVSIGRQEVDPVLGSKKKNQTVGERTAA
jgi:hypothetical protein